MLAALVIIGAAACTENYDGIEKTNEAEVFSFYAEVVNDGTRAYIEKDGDVWNTKWELGDKLYVTPNGENGAGKYEFECTDVEKGKFTCYDSAVANLAGQPVTIASNGDHYSLEGKKAFHTTASVEAFGNGANIEFTALTSFFRYTYNGEGEVKITLSEKLFRNADKTFTDEITISGQGEQFVAFWPNGKEVKLTFSANGETKEVTKTFAAGMVYNLGDRTPVYKVYVHKYKNDWSNVNLYSWSTVGGVNVTYTGNWPGTSTAVIENVNGYDYLVWTMPTTANGADLKIILNNGTNQTADFTLGALNKDYYLLLNGEVPSIIEDLENPEPNEDVKVNVYVMVKDLGWTSVYHVDGNTATKMTETTTVAGHTFYSMEVTAGATNLVFRNTSTASSSGFKVETGDITIKEETYFRLSPRGAIKIDPNDVTTFGYAIYVFDQKSKNVAPNLYVWDDNSAFNNVYGGNFAGWPGIAFKNQCYYTPANNQNWKHYYYYDIPTALYGKGFKFVVNKTGQSSDLVVTKLASDLYVGYWYDSTSSNGFWTNNNLSTPITQ